MNATKLPSKKSRVSENATAAKNVSSTLATAFVGDARTVIGMMRAGAPATIIPEMAARLRITQEMLLANLRLPKSTVKNRITRGQTLAPTELDRVYRANRVLIRASEVLEDEGVAVTWVTDRNRTLGGEAPLAMLDTEAGYESGIRTCSRRIGQDRVRRIFLTFAHDKNTGVPASVYL